MLYGCVDGEGEGGFCLGELRRGLKVRDRIKRNGHVYNLLNSGAPERRGGLTSRKHDEGVNVLQISKLFDRFLGNRDCLGQRRVTGCI